MCGFRLPSQHPLNSSRADRSKALPARGDLHFITFSCYRRQPYLSIPGAYPTLEQALEETRKRHNLEVHGYVFMPEHLHLLVSEPPTTVLADALKYFKWSTSRRLKGDRPNFWQARYYDFNVFTHDKRIEKLRYMHRNAVKRGLVTEARDWPWSSFNHYKSNHPGLIQITQR